MTKGVNIFTSPYFVCFFFVFFRYIYIPLGGSRKGILRQLLGSAVCFAFIFWWHGAEWYLLYWCMANFVGICLETGGRLFSQLPRVVHWEVCTFSFINCILCVNTGGNKSQKDICRKTEFSSWAASHV